MFEEVATPALPHCCINWDLTFLVASRPVTYTGDVLTSQIAEDRITFSLNYVTMTEMTLAKIQKVNSKVELTMPHLYEICITLLDISWDVQDFVVESSLATLESEPSPLSLSPR